MACCLAIAYTHSHLALQWGARFASAFAAINAAMHLLSFHSLHIHLHLCICFYNCRLKCRFVFADACLQLHMHLCIGVTNYTHSFASASTRECLRAWICIYNCLHNWGYQLHKHLQQLNHRICISICTMLGCFLVCFANRIANIDLDYQ